MIDSFVHTVSNWLRLTPPTGTPNQVITVTLIVFGVFVLLLCLLFVIGCFLTGAPVKILDVFFLVTKIAVVPTLIVATIVGLRYKCYFPLYILAGLIGLYILLFAILAIPRHLENRKGKMTTELYNAIEQKNISQAIELIKKGANGNRTELFSGRSPLAYTVCFLDFEKENVLINAFLENKIELRPEQIVCVVQRKDEENQIKILKKFLDAGLKINQSFQKGTTLLMCAANEGNTQTVKFLLDVGADVNAKAENGNTALKLAQKSGNEKIVELLKQAGAKE